MNKNGWRKSSRNRAKVNHPMKILPLILAVSAVRILEVLRFFAIIQNTINLQPFWNYMATLTIKNIPQQVYQELKQLAVEHRRSLNSEVIITLEQAVQGRTSEPASLLETARQLRLKSKKHFLTNKELNVIKDKGRL